MRRHSKVIEITVLSLAVILFCRGFLDFLADGQLPGVEGDVFQLLDWVLYNSFHAGDGFPLWNHIVDTGQPYVADPMLHCYNPVVSLPVLLFGVWDGFKIALLLSIALAAIGMWWLMYTLGVDGPARMWAAMMFAFAGQPNARFLQGQYLFLLGYAWIPWGLAGLLRAMRSRNPRDYAAAVLPLALLFFSGNVYYSFFMIGAGLLLAGSLVVTIQPRRPVFTFDLSGVRALLFIAAAALLLIAVQLLPNLAFLPYLNKAQELAGSHSPYQILLDFTSRDWFRPDAYSSLPAKEEIYAYLGWTPFLALPLLLFTSPALRRWIKPLALILGLAVVWIGLDWMPWHNAFADFKILAQFRHLLRIQVFSGLALVGLAGLGLEGAWARLQRMRQDPDSIRRRHRMGVVGTGLAVAYMLIGPVDLFLSHSLYNRTQVRVKASYDAAAMLKAYDPGLYLTRFEPTTDGHDALAALGHRFLSAWYHFTEMRSLHPDERWETRPVIPGAEYYIQFAGDPPPIAGLDVVATVGSRRIYRDPGQLPFAFVAADDVLLHHADASPLTYGEVQAAEASWLNNITLQASVDPDRPSTFVAEVSYHPSWQARVDGVPATARNISGLLGVPILPGAESVTLRFVPVDFYIGIGLSAVACLLLLGWILFPRSMDPERLWQASLRAARGIHLVSTARILFEKRASKFKRVGQTISQMPSENPETTVNQAGLQGDVNFRLPDALQDKNWAWLLGIALVIYALSRFIAIDRYPIYFFTDEAIQANLAADLLRDHLHGGDGIFLPTYFKNVYEYNLSLSVYLQVLPTYLFGKSVLVTRMASAVVTVFGAAAVGLCFSLLTDRRWAWMGVMLFGLMPAWFLHSRTAFETSLMVSMYAGFLCAYMLYMVRSPRYVYLVVLFAALTFYSYAPGQIIILMTSALLLFVDRQVHWANRRTLLWAIPLLVLLAVPYLRFQALLPGEHTNALRMLESHWVKEGSLESKLLTSFGYYLQSINPAYWFTPNVKDLVRHQVDAFGHLLLPAAPLLVFGAFLALKRRKEPAVKTLLVSVLAIPTAGVLVGVGITRVLSLVIPFALLSGLALVWLLARIREQTLLRVHTIALFTLLAGIQVGMLTDALIRGPRYTDEYGMIGLQWGAREIFAEIEQLQQRDPGLRIFLSPTWANGTDVLARFFFPDSTTLSIANAEGYLEEMRDLNDEMVFVLTQPELDQLRADPKIGTVQVLDELHYPDGSPGFSFVTFSYSEDAPQIFAAQEAERLRPRVDKLAIQGERVTIEYPYLDMGEVANLFDGDTYTLARVYDANPAILSLGFGAPRSIQGVTLSTGSMDFELLIRALDVDGAELASASGTYIGYPDDPTIELDFSTLVSNVDSLILEITSLTPGDPFKIHLRELSIR